MSSTCGKDGSKGLNFEKAGGSADEFFESCKQHVLVAKSVVSVTAALCLLRTQSLGAASAEGQAMMTKLAGVCATLNKQVDELKVFEPASKFFSLQSFQ